MLSIGTSENRGQKVRRVTLYERVRGCEMRRKLDLHLGIVYELDIVESEVASMIRNLEVYAREEKLPVNILTPMDRGYIRKEPYGVVLIVGTWNFPFVVCLLPLVGAIAAGNAVIMKPSEVASFSANILAQLIPQYLDGVSWFPLRDDNDEDNGGGVWLTMVLITRWICHRTATT